MEKKKQSWSWSWVQNTPQSRSLQERFEVMLGQISCFSIHLGRKLQETGMKSKDKVYSNPFCCMEEKRKTSASSYYLQGIQCFKDKYEPQENERWSYLLSKQVFHFCEAINQLVILRADKETFQVWVQNKKLTFDGLKQSEFSWPDNSKNRVEYTPHLIISLLIQVCFLHLISSVVWFSFLLGCY